MSNLLPDVLAPALNLVICGVALGNVSAANRAYYAHPQNKFWQVLFSIGLTPRLIMPSEYGLLPTFGIGLTDLTSKHSGMDKDVPSNALDVDGLRSRILRYKPRLLGFNGKRAAEKFTGHPVEYGRLTETIGETVLFCLPSTSPAAARWWDERLWVEIARYATQTACPELSL